MTDRPLRDIEPAKRGKPDILINLSGRGATDEDRERLIDEIVDEIMALQERSKRQPDGKFRG